MKTNSATPRHTPGPWKVMPCPISGKRHPYHETRFITTEDCEPEAIDAEENTWKCAKGSIIATMRDTRNHRQDAALIASAPELLDALTTFLAFYDDLSKSNPGFMGKLCLQDYSQWNEALYKTEQVLSKLGIKNRTPQREG